MRRTDRSPNHNLPDWQRNYQLLVQYLKRDTSPATRGIPGYLPPYLRYFKACNRSTSDAKRIFHFDYFFLKEYRFDHVFASIFTLKLYVQREFSWSLLYIYCVYCHRWQPSFQRVSSINSYQFTDDCIVSMVLCEMNGRTEPGPPWQLTG